MAACFMLRTLGRQLDFSDAPAESAAEAIMEIRRRSGLTWQELGDLFDVSRRGIHHWANGKPVSAQQNQAIRRMLVAIRQLDRGSQPYTRALLLAVDQNTGISRLDLLQVGRFDEAARHAACTRMAEPRHMPRSDDASDTRRPPPPTLLLGAKHDRPDIPAKARTARVKRTPRAAE